MTKRIDKNNQHENWDIIVDSRSLKMLLKEYHEQLFAGKVTYLNTFDQYLEIYI